MSERPLVPAYVDLTSFTNMDVDVVRLRASRAAAILTGDQFMAWWLLICASWHQVPAASLPDDDVELAQLAGFGRFVNEWNKVKDGALYGWIACDDGRLYNRFAAEKALKAWENKIQSAYRRYKWKLKDHAKDFDAWRADYETSLNDAVRSRNAFGTERGASEMRRNTVPDLSCPDPSCPDPSLPEIDPRSNGAAPSYPFREALDAYNEMAERVGIPIAQRLTEQRKVKLRRRLDDCDGMDGWMVALDKIEASPFCRGDNDKGWAADFDFLLQESSFTRLMEGRYDNRAGNRGPRPVDNSAALDAVLRDIEARENTIDHE